MKKVFNTKESIIMIVNEDYEYTYFKDSMKIKVRYLPTGEATAFDMDELQEFLTIVREEIRKELLQSC